MTARVIRADCTVAMLDLALDGVQVDAIVTDPPYHLTSIVKRFGSASAAPAKSNGATGVYRRASAGFMGQTWDGGDVAFRPETWALAYELLKPGGHLVAFSGTRTYHRMACAVEDAGFEIRDQLGWLYGTGFPKSLDVSKAIDKAGGDPLAWRAFAEEYAAAVSASAFTHADIDRHLGIKASSCYWTRCDHRGGMPPRHHWGKIVALLDLPAEFEKLYEAAERETIGRYVEGSAPGGFGEHRFSFASRDITAPATQAAKQWAGWGTALKPAWEPIVLARKPLAGTVAANVLEFGTGALNIDGCRVPVDDAAYARSCSGDRGHADSRSRNMDFGMGCGRTHDAGRWPANVIHDGSAEVLEAFAAYGDNKGAAAPVHQRGADKFRNTFSVFKGNVDEGGSTFRGDTGSAARFFYSAKATAKDRTGSKHPTVKPVSLMRWLCRLITPPGGVVLDPFAGSGTTLQAALEEGFGAIGIEQSAEYVADIRRRLDLAEAALLEEMLA